MLFRDLFIQLQPSPCLAKSDQRLQLPCGYWWPPGQLMVAGAELQEKTLQPLLGLRSEHRMHICASILQIRSQQLGWQRTLHIPAPRFQRGLDCRHPVPPTSACPHAQHMIRQPNVVIRLVLQEEDEVKSAQQRVGHDSLQVLLNGLSANKAALPRVGSNDDRSSSLQIANNAGFGDRDCLLFHRLEKSLLVSPHLVKLINTTDPLVGQHQGTTFQREIPSGGLPDHGASQPGERGGVAGNIHSSRAHGGGCPQELTFSKSWIPEQQHVDVTPATHRLSITCVLRYAPRHPE
mmetsp:Transcript_92317/g.246922  ORF Transcript_92317/g.246922 Transcript_92317/m.246922 type:complete len:292 (-) Transcript_92317:250-1125(-)